MFWPYHHFENCVTLKRCIKQLSDLSCIPQETYNRYHNYHGALEHKLKGTKYNLDNLENLIQTTNIANISENLPYFMFKANLYIDGFFYNGGSALDILAREILALFNIQPTVHVYYYTAHSEIYGLYPSDSLLARLTDPPWKDEFSDYRNAATHEVLLSTGMNLNIQFSTGGQSQSLRLPLPDDPRAAPLDRTFHRNPDALDYCTKTFKRLLRHINTIYGDIATRASANGRLPLP